MNDPLMTPSTKCTRCGRPAMGQPTQKPEARMLRRAVKGVCVDCGVILFLQRLANMYTQLLPEGATWAEALRLPHVQKQFEAVMRAAPSEATPDEIDWERVIELWDIAPMAKDSLF